MINVKILDSNGGVVLALYNPAPAVINLVKILHPDYADDIEAAGIKLTRMMNDKDTAKDTVKERN